ncbi:hypothetical protein ACHQM5_005622 [Ranunculus cassubicifolius]
MKLWKRASALLKDQNSIYLARLSKKSPFRHPDLEEAVIKATSHDEKSIDYKNAQRIFTWIRTSQKFVQPVIWSLSTRMEKTRSWVVALKGLMLMHGIFCCKIPAVQKIGRLPFDFSNFNDGYTNNARTWGLSAFIRSYFAFLDQKSSLDIFEDQDGNKGKEKQIIEALEQLQRSQTLLDMLLQVKPDSNAWADVLIIEAMDCIVIEIFDVYSKICNAIAGVLVRIYTATQTEAEMALQVLRKATLQGDELDSYFEFCRNIKVLNASEFPRVEKIPDEDIQDLERLISNISNKEKEKQSQDSIEELNEKQSQDSIEDLKEDSMSMALSNTVITDNWVLFEDDIKADEERRTTATMAENTASYVDPFAASINVPPLFYGSSYDDSMGWNGVMQLQYHYSHLQGSQGGHERNMILSLV